MFSLGKHEMFRAQKQPFEQNDTREKKNTHTKRNKNKNTENCGLHFRQQSIHRRKTRSQHILYIIHVYLRLCMHACMHVSCACASHGSNARAICFQWQTTEIKEKTINSHVPRQIKKEKKTENKQKKTSETEFMSASIASQHQPKMLCMTKVTSACYRNKH